MEMDHRQASSLFSQADVDKSGSISFEEFKNVCAKTGFTFRTPQDGPQPDHVQLSSLSRAQVIRIRKYFSKYDRNRDGRLTIDEFSKLIKVSHNMSENSVKRAHALKKKDTSITFREFLQIFATKEELDLCVADKKLSFDESQPQAVG